MNKALLDTDIFPEFGNGVDGTAAQSCVAHRATHGRYTISVTTLMVDGRCWS